MPPAASKTKPQSKDLTPEEGQKKAELAFAIDQRIKAAALKGREAMWELAEALYEFNEENGWLALGHETMAEWLADSEVGMTYSTYRKLVSLWDELAVQRKVKPKDLALIDYTKAVVVLPAIKDQRVTVKEALSDAKMMGKRDLRETYLGTREPPPIPGENGDDGDGAPDPAPVDPQPADEAAWADGNQNGTPEAAEEGSDGPETAVAEDIEGTATDAAPPTAEGEEGVWLDAKDQEGAPLTSGSTVYGEEVAQQAATQQADPDLTFQQTAHRAGLICIDRVDVESLHSVLAGGTISSKQLVELAEATIAEWLAIDPFE